MTQKQHHTESLSRISELRDQSFGEAYAKHDVGTALVRDRCAEFRLTVFSHGDDRRDQDVYSGTGVDLGIEKGDTTCGWIEVKCKSSREWLGRLNKHDWEEYRGFATLQDCPVYVSFFLVEDVDTAAVSKSHHVRVPPSTEDDIATDLPFTSKGHELVEIADDHFVGWPTVIASVYEEVIE